MARHPTVRVGLERKQSVQRARGYGRPEGTGGMTMTMTEGTRRDPASVLERLSEHWGWLLLLGVITVVAGIAALAWPGLTLLVVAVLFGAQLIVMGIFRFVSAFASDDVT